MTPGAPRRCGTAVDLDQAAGPALATGRIGWRRRGRVALGQQRAEVVALGHASQVPDEAPGAVPPLNLIDYPSGVVVVTPECFDGEPLGTLAR